MRTRVLPYKRGSRSAKALAEALGVLRLKLTGSKFRPRPSDLIINWGLSNVPENLLVATVLNAPDAVARVSNKLTFFRAMGEYVPEIIPPFWTEQGEIPDDAFPIVCRTVLTGHSGDGIVVAHTREELVPAPLYTKYIKKKDEYRIHVGSANRVISMQRKARKRDVPDEEVNWLIRNHKNGFVFVRNDVNPPDCVIQVAHRALVASGLDFGAADVVYNEAENRAYVLEINSAPGLEGSTVQDYVRFFTGEEDEDEGHETTGDSGG